MPDLFADVIRQHGGEWLEWERKPSCWTVGAERWIAASGGVEYALTGLAEVDATAPDNLRTFLAVERNGPNRASSTKLYPGKHCQTLENWFYQARMEADQMALLTTKAAALYSHAPPNITLEVKPSSKTRMVCWAGRGVLVGNTFGTAILEDAVAVFRNDDRGVSVMQFLAEDWDPQKVEQSAVIMDQAGVDCLVTALMATKTEERWQGLMAGLERVE